MVIQIHRDKSAEPKMMNDNSVNIDLLDFLVSASLVTKLCKVRVT